MRPRSLGRLISIMSTLRAWLSVPVSTKRKTHPIHDPPAGNLPDRSYGSRRHPPNLWAIPFRMHMVGYFEGIDSERGIEWRCSDSLSLREFLRLETPDRVPDHSWLSKTRGRL